MICTRCRSERAVWEVRHKSFMGRFGVDCLFSLKGIHRDESGNWQKRHWEIERIKHEDETPKEFVQSSIRSRLKKASEISKHPASLWRRIQLEACSRASGIVALGSKPETFFIRTACRFLLMAGWTMYQTEELTNELIARRFPGATIKTEVNDAAN